MGLDRIIASFQNLEETPSSPPSRSSFANDNRLLTKSNDNARYVMADSFAPSAHQIFDSHSSVAAVPIHTVQSVKHTAIPPPSYQPASVQNIDPRDTELNRILPQESEAIHYQQPTPEPSFQDPVFGRQGLQTTPVSSTHNGNPVPVSQSPVISSAKSSTLLKAQATPSIPQISSIDDAAILLSLAEDYISAAYQSSAQLHENADELGLRAYYKAIATALGCFETVISRCFLKPEQEATIRLRYASILYQETDNDMEAEEALSKGITIADRHKLFDLKYNMQHLLVRVLYKSRPPAAFKCLDRNMHDAQVHRHIAWFYAFSLLKASLHLELAPDSIQESKAAVKTLTNVISVADHLGDEPVMAIASTMKAWASLRLSDTPDSFEESQTSLALARKVQDRPSMHEAPQIRILIGLTDLCSHLQNYSFQQIPEKWEYIQSALGHIAECKDWFADGSFSLPLHHDTMLACRQRSGVVALCDREGLQLQFNWIPKEQIYAIAFMLHGLATSPQKASEQPALEKSLVEGISKESWDLQQIALCRQSIVAFTESQLTRQHLTSFMRLRLGFVLCCRSDFGAARQQLDKFYNSAAVWSAIPPALKQLSDLLHASCSHGNGCKELALQEFGLLNFPVIGQNPQANHFLKDISRIAILNSLLLLKNSGQADQVEIEALFQALSTDCQKHRNTQIEAAFLLIQYLYPQMMTIPDFQRKHVLQYALSAAKKNYDRNLLTVILSVMYVNYYKGQHRDQAERNARAALNVAQMVKNKLWISVTKGNWAEYLETDGKSDEARLVYQEGLEVANSLSPLLKAGLGLLGTGSNEESSVR